MTVDELKVVLDKHQKWLREEVGGERANLSGAYLSGANLFRADLSGANLYGADLSRADLSGVYLSRADLFRAYLSGANLSGAYLSGANLSGANLSGADLSSAYLSGADLSGAIGIHKYLTTPLYGMTDAVGPIRAYKLVTGKYQGPCYPTITYHLGETYYAEIDLDENNHCGAGINLATLDWVMREWREGYHILIAEFEIKDAAKDICIPIGSDGKFRVRECRIVGEKDLVQLGLVDPPKKKARPKKSDRKAG